MDSESDSWFENNFDDERGPFVVDRFDNGIAAADRAGEEFEFESTIQPEERRVIRSQEEDPEVAKKKYQDALNRYNVVMESQRNESGYHANTAALLSEMKRYDDAMAAADRALQLDATFQYAKDIKAHVLNELGHQAYDAQRYEEALQKYTQASQLNPRSKYYIANRSSVLNNLHRYNEAVSAAKKALELDGGYLIAKFRMAHALNELGKIEFNEGRYKEALENFTQASNNNPYEKCYHANRASVLNYLFKYDEAILAADRALQLDGNYLFAKEKKAYALNKHGDTLLERKQSQEAMEKYGAVLEIDPNNFHAKNKCYVIKHLMSEKNLN